MNASPSRLTHSRMEEEPSSTFYRSSSGTPTNSCYYHVLSWVGRGIPGLFTRDEDPVLAKKTDPELCTSNKRRFLKVYWMNILDNIKSLLFCFHTSGVRRTIYVLDSENQPESGSVQIRTVSGSGALGLTRDVWYQKYETKKRLIKLSKIFIQ